MRTAATPRKLWTDRNSQAAAYDRALPEQSALVFDLSPRHLAHQPLEVLIRKVGAYPPQTPGYLFANCFLSEGVERGDSVLGVGLLV